MTEDEGRPRRHRAKPIDATEVLRRPHRRWLLNLWRWLRRGPPRDPLRRRGAWPLARRVIDLRSRRR